MFDDDRFMTDKLLQSLAMNDGEGALSAVRGAGLRQDRICALLETSDLNPKLLNGLLHNDNFLEESWEPVNQDSDVLAGIARHHNLAKDDYNYLLNNYGLPCVQQALEGNDGEGAKAARAEIRQEAARIEAARIEAARIEAYHAANEKTRILNAIAKPSTNPAEAIAENEEAKEALKNGLISPDDISRVYMNRN